MSDINDTPLADDNRLPGEDWYGRNRWEKFDRRMIPADPRDRLVEFEKRVQALEVNPASMASFVARLDKIEARLEAVCRKTDDLEKRTRKAIKVIAERLTKPVPDNGKPATPTRSSK